MANSERTEAAHPTAAAPSTSSAAPSAAASAAARAATEEISRPTPSPEAIEACTVSCLTNAQYHASREAFLDTIHRWVMFLVIAFGGAALTDILPRLTGADAKLTTDLLVAASAILAALDLTFDLSNRARTHAMMKRRYFELLADLREGHKTPEHVKVCIEQFSADEEPQFRVLFLTCWNAAQEAVYGNARHRYHIGFFPTCSKTGGVARLLTPGSRRVRHHPRQRDRARGSGRSFYDSDGEGGVIRCLRAWFSGSFSRFVISSSRGPLFLCLVSMCERCVYCSASFNCPQISFSLSHGASALLSDLSRSRAG